VSHFEPYSANHHGGITPRKLYFVCHETVCIGSQMSPDRLVAGLRPRTRWGKLQRSLRLRKWRGDSIDPLPQTPVGLGLCHLNSG